MKLFIKNCSITLHKKIKYLDNKEERKEDD